MDVFRLTRKKFSETLSGKGAAIRGARWNSTGVEMIYTAANRSLAMAEVAVHFTLATIPEDYVMVTILIPESVNIKKLDPKKLPSGWNTFPYSASTQRIGDKFISENKYGVMRVPSVVTRGDYNLLINPHHVDFSKIRIKSTEPFPLDGRIFR